MKVWPRPPGELTMCVLQMVVITLRARLRLLRRPLPPPYLDHDTHLPSVHPVA